MFCEAGSGLGDSACWTESFGQERPFINENRVEFQTALEQVEQALDPLAAKEPKHLGRIFSATHYVF